MELGGRRALVTGAGAIGGIGHEVARALLAAGAEVIVTGRDPGRGEEAAAALGERARFELADLADLDSVAALAASAGRLDVLVNNASGYSFATALEQDVEAFDALFAVNVRGAYFLVQAVASGMIAAGRGGAIVNVSSIAADLAMPGISVYSAAKAALQSLTRSWAEEFGRAGIRVNTVAPGAIASRKLVTSMPEAIDELGEATALGRVGSSEEIAAAVAFLASDRASYITGTCVAVDGGRSLT